MPNFNWKNNLWLALVKLQTHVYYTVYKKTDEFQLFFHLSSHSYEDVATKIFYPIYLVDASTKLVLVLSRWVRLYLCFC